MKLQYLRFYEKVMNTLKERHMFVKAAVVGTENSICMIVAWGMNKHVGPACLKLNGVADQSAD